MWPQQARTLTSDKRGSQIGGPCATSGYTIGTAHAQRGHPRIRPTRSCKSRAGRCAVRKRAARVGVAAIDVRGGCVTVSGELQDSVIVERRGNPQTYGELLDYLRSAIRVLQSMVGDRALALARSPRRRPYIRSSKPKRYGTPSSRLLHLSPMMRSASSALRSSTGMRCSPMLRSRNIGAATKSEPHVASRRAGLDARLPAAAPAEEPASLAYTRQSPNGEQC